MSMFQPAFIANFPELSKQIIFGIGVFCICISVVAFFRPNWFGKSVLDWFKRTNQITDTDQTNGEIDDGYNAPIWVAIQHVAILIGEPKDTRFFPQARAIVRQAALDGKLRVWGRKQIPPPHPFHTHHFDNVLIPIDSSYWKNSQISAFAAVPQDHMDNPSTLPMSADAWKENEHNAFADLRFNEQEGLALWP